MKRAGTSEKYQNNNLKAIIAYSKFLGPSISFYEIENKSQVISFLDTKIKNSEDDPDKRWITTWNDYLVRIKYFFRWMYNCKDKDLDDVSFSEWVTPEFVKIKNKKTKRISPYLENELWEKDDLLTIIKYESYKRNKAILALLITRFITNNTANPAASDELINNIQMISMSIGKPYNIIEFSTMVVTINEIIINPFFLFLQR